MTDLAVLCLLAACVYLTFLRPWLGVLALAVFGYLQPHAFATGFMHAFPAYQVLFVALCAAALYARKPLQMFPDWRFPVFVALWLYFLFTTSQAIAPWAAWPRFFEITKILLPLAFTVLLIDTRDKLYYLIATIALSFGLIAVKGGYWALVTGFADRVYGPPGSHFYDNNQFAVAVIMTLPLLVLCLRETAHRGLRYVLMAALGLSAAAALSSWSRGALLTLLVTSALLFWHSRRRYLAVPVLIAGVLFALYALPEPWFERMQTISAYQEEGGAAGRLQAWRDGVAFAMQRPFTGAGFDGWRYVTVNTARIDWHNSYVEVLAEHGVIAFGLWSALLFGTIVGLTRLARRAANSPGLAWVANYSAMLRAALIAYATGALFLGLAYWDIFYHLIILAVLLRRLAVRAARAGAAPQAAASSDTAAVRAAGDPT